MKSLKLLELLLKLLQLQLNWSQLRGRNPKRMRVLMEKGGEVTASLGRHWRLEVVGGRRSRCLGELSSSWGIVNRSLEGNRLMSTWSTRDRKSWRGKNGASH